MSSSTAQQQRPGYQSNELPNGAQIICRDNGKGFNPEKVSLSSGMGLIGIGERVRMLGGRYTMVSAPGKGVTIYITI